MVSGNNVTRRYFHLPDDSCLRFVITSYRLEVEGGVSPPSSTQRRSNTATQIGESFRFVVLGWAVRCMCCWVPATGVTIQCSVAAECGSLTGKHSTGAGFYHCNMKNSAGLLQYGGYLMRLLTEFSLADRLRHRRDCCSPGVHSTADTNVYCETFRDVCFPPLALR